MFLKVSNTRTFLSLLTLGASLGAFIASPVDAQAEESAFTKAQKAELQEIIKAYLEDNGELVMKSINTYQAQQKAKEAQRSKEKLKEKIEILTDLEAPSVGPADADVVVVEFFDYNCGYCKRALKDVQTLIEKDKNVRVVFREMPILGDSSHVAAKWAMAAHKQGKYFDFHVALMSHRGPKSEAALAKLAETVGLDVEQMKKDVESPDVAAEIDSDLKLGREIGVRGTPAFIVGEEFYPGYLGTEGLRKAVEKARSGKE